mmetsp:Transcript_9710/g.19761  ORF Transcript_9710/g.19761 Transcript_9710/m.19761 type:complete len:162 (-) Transcript_9710:1131-1616(-)
MNKRFPLVPSTATDGKLSYSEFFLSLWNFCTLTHETLVKFAFDLYDLDGSGSLTIDEVFEMVTLMHPSRDAKYAKVQTKKLMEIMDRGEDGGDDDISFPEFLKAHRKLGTVIFPAFMLQKAIRGRGMSKVRWRVRIEAAQFTRPTCFSIAAPHYSTAEILG